MKWTTLALIVGSGSVVGYLMWQLWRAEAEASRTDLVPRWKAFMERDVIIDGKPTIVPLALPEVRALKGERAQPWKTRRFAQGRR